MSLGLYVGGAEPLAPIEVDRGFRWYLPRLRQLQIPEGIWHRGPEPSRLEPPFAGLSGELEGVRIDAWDPEPVAQALRERIGERVSVPQRVRPDSAYGAWVIHPPDSDGGEWMTYGSLCDALRGGVGMGGDLLVTWPGAEISFTDPSLAANVVGSSADAPAIERVAGDVRPYGAAGVMAVDEIIEPSSTRTVLCAALDRAAARPRSDPCEHPLASWPMCW